MTGSVLILHDGARATSDAISHELGVFSQPALAAAMVNPSIGRYTALLAESALERLLTTSVTALL